MHTFKNKTKNQIDMSKDNNIRHLISYDSAVSVIKAAILKSQARAAQAVNQEMLALYYGIGKYISHNSR